MASPDPKGKHLGFFVTLEGPEGAGKSTLAQALHGRLVDAGVPVMLTYEPGGTPLGRQLREILLHSRGDALDPRAEALLLCAARAQLVSDVILPALQAGQVVISDRYGDSTMAYQGYGRGLPLNSIRHALDFATQSLTPDLTFLLDLDPASGLARKPSDARYDRFERQDAAFHRRVREGYLRLAKADPLRWVILDASKPAGIILEQASTELYRRVPVLRDGSRAGHTEGTLGVQQ